MKQYTTGEIAKLCNISVRTVQYYDNRGILSPSALSEGGRRLYSEEDLKRMKTICILRKLNLSLKTIEQLFDKEYTDKADKSIDYFLKEQQDILRKEIVDKTKTIHYIEQLRTKSEKQNTHILDSINELSLRFNDRKKLHRHYAIIIATNLPFMIFGTIGFFLGIFKANWWVLAFDILLYIPYLFWMVPYYLKHVSYICPNCHQIFNPSIKEAFFAKHTIDLRNLTCPHCNKKNLCIEIYRRSDS